MSNPIVTLAKAATAAAFLLVFSACETRGITGSGNVTTESRPITGTFKSIEVSNGLDLVIEQSGETKIEVEADDNLQKHIKTTISNGVLTIKCDFNSYRNVTAKQITVRLPVLESLQSSSGTSVRSANLLSSPLLEVNASSGSDVKLQIEADKAVCESSSGSHIEVSGKAITFEASTSSGSGIDAQGLLSNDVTAGASSGSVIEVHPLVSLDAEASSGGVVNYHNEPKSISRRASSGGSISKQ
jgi:hypothetical protein